MKLGILLTATIKVQCIGSHFSLEERLSMYSETLSYYAKRIGKKYPICFVENSDYDLNVLKKRFFDKLDIEFLQFSPASQEYSTTFDTVKGKGYNEYLMIKLAISKSQKINKCTHFLKITGRYAMENIVPVIHEIEKGVMTSCLWATSRIVTYMNFSVLIIWDIGETAAFGLQMLNTTGIICLIVIYLWMTV